MSANSVSRAARSKAASCSASGGNGSSSSGSDDRATTSPPSATGAAVRSASATPRAKRSPMATVSSQAVPDTHLPVPWLPAQPCRKTQVPSYPPASIAVRPWPTKSAETLVGMPSPEAVGWQL